MFMRPLAFAWPLLVTAFGCGGAIDETRDPEGSRNAQDPSKQDSSSWFPDTPCSPAGKVPVRIAEVGSLEITRLVPDGATVWFGAYEPSPSQVAGLYRVPASGGVPTRHSAPDYRAGHFAVVGRELAYVRLTAKSPGKPYETLESIVLQNRDTGSERTVVTPSDIRVADLRTTSTGLFWSNSRTSGAIGGISRFDGSGARSVSEVRFPRRVVSNGKEVFYVEWGETSERRIVAVSVDGGAPREVRRLSSDIYENWNVVGVDATEVYFTRVAPIGHGTFKDGEVRAVRMDGSGERIVVTIPSFKGDVLVDPDFLTWVDDTTSDAIVRVPLAGGATTRIPVGRRVGAIAVDTCNLYWVASEPAELFARSRRP